MDYFATRARVKTYFDTTASDVWKRLTSDEPVSGIRATVRKGREQMRSHILARLPADLRGQRVLDAGCGTGTLSAILAERGAQVIGIDIAPQLLEVARQRHQGHQSNISWVCGDMTDPDLGVFDHVVAMDSLIYYKANDIAHRLRCLGSRTSGVVLFTAPPRTLLLSLMWYAGKMFPKNDRSPVMVPQSFSGLQKAMLARGHGGLDKKLACLASVHHGFYHARLYSQEGSLI